jgi:cell division protein FtsW (lipid II flippase)
MWPRGALPISFSVGVIFAMASLAAYIISPTLSGEWLSGLIPGPYADSAGYQLIQSLFLLAQGGLFGAGNWHEQTFLSFQQQPPILFFPLPVVNWAFWEELLF